MLEPAGGPLALLIDAGNTRIKWALVDLSLAPDMQSASAPGAGSVSAHAADPVGRRSVPLAAGAFMHAEPAAVAADPSRLAPPGWAALAPPSTIWISNVAGPLAAARLDALLATRWPQTARHTIASRASQCGVQSRYTEPTQLGSDRWAGLIGAHAAYPDEHLLIATCGTATTLEALRADGVFTGGLIAPGWQSMMQALGRHAAQLPTLSPADAQRHLNAAGAAQASRFTTDTASSMIEGCRQAQAGLVENAWRALGRELDAPVRCVLGGGDAAYLAAILGIPYTRHDHLVLDGLAVIAAAESGLRENS